MSHYSEILQLIFCGRPGPERAPLPLHGVDAPGLQVYVHQCDVLPTLPHN